MYIHWPVGKKQPVTYYHDDGTVMMVISGDICTMGDGKIVYLTLKASRRARRWGWLKGLLIVLANHFTNPTRTTV